MARTRVLALGLVSLAAWAQQLQFSETSLTFSAAAGGDAAPQRSIAVTSSNQTPIQFSVRTDGGAANIPAPAWLSVKLRNATTPARLVVSAEPLSLPPGAYLARIVIPEGATSGATVIPVTLNLGARPPELEVSPRSLRFIARADGPPAERVVFVRNAGGGGPLAFTAGLKKTPPNGSSVIPSQGRTEPNAPIPVRVTFNVTGLLPGFYRKILRVESNGGGSHEIPLGLFVLGRDSVLGVSPSGLVLGMRQGNGTSLTRNLTISAVGFETINWTAELVQGDDWLNLSARNGVSRPTDPSQVRISTENASLAADDYYALIRVSSPQAPNSPVFVPVVLNVLPPNARLDPDPSPEGLFFVARAGQPPPAPQSVGVFASSNATVGYQSSATTDDNSGWLSVSPANGTTSRRTGQAAVSVTHANLRPGIFRGEASISLSTTEIRSVNVVLIVLPALPGRAAEGCTPTRLAPIATDLVASFNVPASWPVPLAIRLFDDCGDPVLNGQIVANFSNGDPPLNLSLNHPNGTYSGTWVPRSSAAQMTVAGRATAPGLPVAVIEMTGAIRGNKAPVLTDDGIVNNLNPQPGGALAPGTVVQIFGSDMASVDRETGTVPLPKSFNGTRVLIGGVEAPLYFVSPGQINAQIPTELPAERLTQVVVSANGAFAIPDTIALTPVQPGVAAFADGRLIAQHTDFSLISSSAPARPGEFIVIYLTGMGATDPQVASGAPSPAMPANVKFKPLVTIDGKSAQILFAGLTPGGVGLYQINLQVPADSRSGDLALVVEQEGAQSNTTVLPVR
ncbi:MAG: BACON domain-containing protein [Bryobacteraceae bacterium]